MKQDEKVNQVFDASFRIIDNDLDPEQISSLLGIKPDHSHRKGEPNNKRTKSGKVIIGHPYKTGIWNINSNLPETSSLEEHLNSLLDRLEPVGDKIKQLSIEGYRVDFYCACFTEHEFQGGFDVGPDILERMGRMGIILGISTYEM
jgi:hypothetical protein